MTQKQKCVWKKAGHSDKDNPKKTLSFPKCEPCEGYGIINGKKCEMYLPEKEVNHLD